MKENLIQQISKQSNETIGAFLNSLCQQGIYTEHTNNLTPMLLGKDAYIVGTNEQIVAVLIDTERPWNSDTLCDEEHFSDDTEPLWFEETCHRFSPVYRLMQFTHALRQLCRILGKIQPTIHCVLLTQAHLINFDDQKPLYDYLGVTVFHHMKNLNSFSMDTGSGKDTPAARLIEDYKKNLNILSWNPDEQFDKTAEEYIKDATSFAGQNDDKNMEDLSSDLDGSDDDDEWGEEDCSLPDIGALRAELIAPMPRHKETGW